MTPEELFLTLLNRSLAAVWLVLAILLLRPFLKKVSRSFCCAMWGLVAIRLLCPFSIRSVLSLIPDPQPIPTDLAAQSAVANGSAVSGAYTVAGDLTSALPAGAADEAVSPALTFTRVAAVLWIVGMALILLYALVSYLHLRSLVREAVKHPDGYWQCDRIETPFVLGLFRPRILLPLAMDAGDLPYVLAHERAHLERRDHWRKPIAFALLAVFWFQPVLWVAYFLLRRDVEFACDERAIRKLGVDLESRKCYAKALLRGSSPAASAAKLTCPLAFGGLQVKRRVKSVMTYKCPAMTLLLAALLVCAAVAVCFLTDPVSSVVAFESPKDNAETGEATPAEPSSAPVDTAGSSEKPPAEEGSEERELEEWIASLPSSWNATKEEWTFAFIFSRVYQSYEEDGAVHVFKNIGTRTVTLTLAEQYWRHADLTPEEGRALVEAMAKDPSVSAPYVMFTSEIVTVEIPVGETVRLSLDPDLLESSVYGVYNGISATYGSLSGSNE